MDDKNEKTKDLKEKFVLFYKIVVIPILFIIFINMILFFYSKILKIEYSNTHALDYFKSVKISNFIVYLLLLLPGFIMCNIVDLTNPPKKFQQWRYAITCVLFSIMNIGCCFIYYIWLISLEDDRAIIVFIISSVLLSSIIASYISYIKQHEYFNDFVEKWFNLNSIGTTPTAWGKLFSQFGESYVKVTLKDDTVFYGFWSDINSVASTDEDIDDIFIEKIYKNDKWEEDEADNGLYISKGQIKCIELMKEGESCQELD